MMAVLASRLLLYGGSYKTSFDHLSDAQVKACQIVLRIAAVFSLLGSGSVVYSLMGPKRESDLKQYLFSRLLLGLCVSDIFSSTILFLGAWPIPSDSFHGDKIDGNVGNQLTCNLQGFGLQLFYFSSVFYTAALSVNFLLCVKYEWQEEDLKRRVEPALHAVSWFVPLVLAVLPWIFDMYNPTAFFCYVVTYPIGCDHYDDVDCIRGDHSWFWRSIAQIVPFGVCLLTICYCMASLYKTVRQQEKAVSRHSNAFIRNKRQRSRIALRRGSMFIGAFLVVWTPILLVALMEDLGQKIPFGIWIIDAFMIPIMGLFNAIVYAEILKEPVAQAVRESVLNFTNINGTVAQSSTMSRLLFLNSKNSKSSNAMSGPFDSNQERASENIQDLRETADSLDNTPSDVIDGEHYNDPIPSPATPCVENQNFSEERHA